MVPEIGRSRAGGGLADERRQADGARDRPEPGGGLADERRRRRHRPARGHPGELAEGGAGGSDPAPHVRNYSLSLSGTQARRGFARQSGTGSGCRLPAERRNGEKVFCYGRLATLGFVRGGLGSFVDPAGLLALSWVRSSAWRVRSWRIVASDATLVITMMRQTHQPEETVAPDATTRGRLLHRVQQPEAGCCIGCNSGRAGWGRRRSNRRGRAGSARAVSGGEIGGGEEGLDPGQDEGR